ncbi:MAG: hypothetical protein HY329_20725 [Chloroflexi bacterium]|nr:hypothetical protein [Chloroflexota bacterium]
MATITGRPSYYSPVATPSEGIGNLDRLSSREVIKFGGLVGLAGIFFDAAIAHGLFWENDPYWTYWITKTFLITTVFSLATAFFGIGIVQGVIGTAVHTLVLEVYYQWLSPIGLPRESQWLDFDHLWITGVPVHYAVIFAGYLTALWLWRRRPAVWAVQPTVRRLGLFAVVATVAVLVLDGIITQALILREYPGLTFFVVRALLSVPFFMALAAYVGTDWRGIVAGSACLALIWTSYSMYLGPTGLPSGPVEYPGYEKLWLRAFPGQLVAMVAGTWLAARLTGLYHARLDDVEHAGIDDTEPHGRGVSRWVAVGLVLLMGVGAASALIAGIALAGRPDAPGIEVGATASGDALITRGAQPYALESAVPASGRLESQAVDTGGRWSPLQSKDTMQLTAELTHPGDGASYRVVMNTPMRQEPEGRYTTWFGVSLGHAHHGDTGIDSSALPRVASELALWGYADVYRNGTLIAGGKPAHMMVVRKDQGQLPGQVFLSVATEKKDLPGTPDGYLNVIWRKVDTLSTPATQGIDLASERQSGAGRLPATDLGQLAQFGRREVVGYGTLAFLIAGLLLLTITSKPVVDRDQYGSSVA